ncbi:MAG: hypothetical protein FK733_07330 [Asgard group archaeon]|nr:hypothetical protein [Asgard group archaeon]
MKTIKLNRIFLIIIVGSLMLNGVNGESDLGGVKDDSILKENSYPILLSGLIWDIYIQGDLLFISRNNGEVEIYDNTNPTDIALIKTITCPKLSRLVAKEDLLITGAYENGEICLIDISDPSFAEIIGRIVGNDPYNYMYDMCISGNYLFIANYSKTVIYDISNPEGVSKIATYTSISPAMKIQVHGNLLFRYGGMHDKVEIVNITQINSPQFLRKIENESQQERVVEIVVKDDYLITFFSYYKAEVYDIKNPKIPALVDLGDLREYVECATYYRNTTFVVDEYQVFLMDITNPENIKTIGLINNTGRIYDVAANGEYLFCDFGEGYGVISVDDAIDYEVIENSPPERTPRPTINLELSGVIEGLSITIIVIIFQKILSEKRRKKRFEK